GSKEIKAWRTRRCGSELQRDCRKRKTIVSFIYISWLTLSVSWSAIGFKKKVGEGIEIISRKAGLIINSGITGLIKINSGEAGLIVNSGEADIVVISRKRT
ncbi:hypothetical protein Tco_0735508, partial [Tanacetum coccineum]